jgi:hypothetical protein
MLRESIVIHKEAITVPTITVAGRSLVIGQRALSAVVFDTVSTTPLVDTSFVLLQTLHASKLPATWKTVKVTFVSLMLAERPITGEPFPTRTVEHVDRSIDRSVMSKMRCILLSLEC